MGKQLFQCFSALTPHLLRPWFFPCPWLQIIDVLGVTPAEHFSLLALIVSRDLGHASFVFVLLVIMALLRKQRHGGVVRMSNLVFMMFPFVDKLIFCKKARKPGGLCICRMSSSASLHNAASAH
jgi:hypothetical protein